MRGEWIEIYNPHPPDTHQQSLSPCGESGLKFGLALALHGAGGLSPCGESGLKSHIVHQFTVGVVSPHAGRVD